MANKDITYMMEYVSTKDLKFIIERAEAELDKRNTLNQEYANQIFNLIDDIRSEEGCTIVLSDHFNYFEIGPDTAFSVKVKDNSDCMDDEEEDEDE